MFSISKDCGVKVFISYARENLETAKKLRDDLEKAGIKTWLDKVDLLPGMNWKATIRKEIRESSYFIALLSSKALSKQGFVHKELKTALDFLDLLPSGSIFVIPVRVDECEPADEKLQDIHWADLFPSYEIGLKDILRVLRRDHKVGEVPEKKEIEKKKIQENPPLSHAPSQEKTIPKSGGKQSISITGDAEKSVLVPGNGNIIHVHTHEAVNEEKTPKIITPISENIKIITTKNLSIKTYRVILIVGTILLVNIVYMTTQPHIRNKLIEIFQGRISAQREKSLIKYQLRKTPITVSDEEVKNKFKLNHKLRPLEYVKNDFKDNGNGTIKDNVTDLMWQKSGSDHFIKYENVEAYVDKLNQEKFAGYSDWRLPTVDELKSLLTPKEMNSDLYIDPIFDKTQIWCLTSDKRASGGAWSVLFDHGLVGWFIDGSGYARAVRSIQ